MKLTRAEEEMISKDIEGIRNRSSGRERLRKRIGEALLKLKGKEELLLRKWQLTMKPSTARTYTEVALSVAPSLKTRPRVRTVVEAGKLLNSLGKITPATPMDAQSLRELQKRDTEVARTALLMWCSVSRWADLGKGVWSEVEKDVWRHDLDVFKSDRYGKRRVTKFVYGFHQPKSILSFRQLNKGLKQMDARFTTYSVRRGAMTHLANLGYSMNQIVLISGHTPTQDPLLAVRRYIQQEKGQPESQTQLEMSKALWRAIRD
jgi:hypothetical protein